MIWIRSIEIGYHHMMGAAVLPIVENYCKVSHIPQICIFKAIHSYPTVARPHIYAEIGTLCFYTKLQAFQQSDSQEAANPFDADHAVCNPERFTYDEHTELGFGITSLNSSTLFACRPCSNVSNVVLKYR